MIGFYLIPVMLIKRPQVIKKILNSEIFVLLQEACKDKNEIVAAKNCRKEIGSNAGGSFIQRKEIV